LHPARITDSTQVVRLVRFGGQDTVNAMLNLRFLLHMTTAALVMTRKDGGSSYEVRITGVHKPSFRPQSRVVEYNTVRCMTQLGQRDLRYIDGATIDQQIAALYNIESGLAPVQVFGGRIVAAVLQSLDLLQSRRLMAEFALHASGMVTLRLSGVQLRRAQCLESCVCYAPVLIERVNLLHACDQDGMLNPTVWESEFLAARAHAVNNAPVALYGSQPAPAATLPGQSVSTAQPGQGLPREHGRELPHVDPALLASFHPALLNSEFQSDPAMGSSLSNHSRSDSVIGVSEDAPAADAGNIPAESVDDAALDADLDMELFGEEESEPAPSTIPQRDSLASPSSSGLALPSKRTADEAGLDTAPPAAKRPEIAPLRSTAALEERERIAAEKQAAREAKAQRLEEAHARMHKDAPKRRKRQGLTSKQGALTFNEVIGACKVRRWDAFTRSKMEDFLQKGPGYWRTGLGSKTTRKEHIEDRLEELHEKGEFSLWMADSKDDGGMFIKNSHHRPSSSSSSGTTSSESDSAAFSSTPSPPSTSASQPEARRLAFSPAPAFPTRLTGSISRNASPVAIAKRTKGKAWTTEYMQKRFEDQLPSAPKRKEFSDVNPDGTPTINLDSEDDADFELETAQPASKQKKTKLTPEETKQRRSEKRKQQRKEKNGGVSPPPRKQKQNPEVENATPEDAGRPKEYHFDDAAVSNDFDHSAEAGADDGLDEQITQAIAEIEDEAVSNEQDDEQDDELEARLHAAMFEEEESAEAIEARMQASFDGDDAFEQCLVTEEEEESEEDIEARLQASFDGDDAIEPYLVVEEEDGESVRYWL
jgi:hypothetical protein